jgi:tRNA (guanine37-N1)-methyltransferase
MKISIITLFPDMFTGPFDASIIKRAKEKKLVEIEYINIRDFGIDKHKIVDDTPYGGGIGMVMRVDVIHAAIEHARRKVSSEKTMTVLMTASGKRFIQQTAQDFAKLDHLIIICGHYEGLDDRIKQYIDAEYSIGDFVLTGGEIPAMLITDAVIRLLPGVITEGATEHESFSYKDENKPLLEYPQYTRPAVYNGVSVPEVLVNGNHKKIDEWRHTEALKKTREVRPDLLK